MKLEPNHPGGKIFITRTNMLSPRYLHPLKNPAPTPVHQAAAMLQFVIHTLESEHGIPKIRADLDRIQGELKTAAAIGPSSVTSNLPLH
jgi:hypothetical protein